MFGENECLYFRYRTFRGKGTSTWKIELLKTGMKIIRKQKLETRTKIDKKYVNRVLTKKIKTKQNKILNKTY